MTSEKVIKPGDKVEVYRNLHKDCFSIRKQGRVVGYLYDDGQHHRSTDARTSSLLYLTNVKFVVQKAGRIRVIQEQRKNVHAFVRGIVTKTGGLHREGVKRKCIRRVTYDPYKMKTFQDQDGNMITEAIDVFIYGGRVYA